MAAGGAGSGAAWAADETPSEATVTATSAVTAARTDERMWIPLPVGGPLVVLAALRS